MTGANVNVFALTSFKNIGFLVWSVVYGQFNVPMCHDTYILGSNNTFTYQVMNQYRNTANATETQVRASLCVVAVNVAPTLYPALLCALVAHSPPCRLHLRGLH